MCRRRPACRLAREAAPQLQQLQGCTTWPELRHALRTQHASGGLRSLAARLPLAAAGEQSVAAAEAGAARLMGVTVPTSSQGGKFMAGVSFALDSAWRLSGAPPLACGRQAPCKLRCLPATAAAAS